jgi:2-keto-3-deoxy-L-rhamnonate aldolase RhmA
MPSTVLRKKVNSGALTLGSWITLPDCAVAELMARAGFDWLVIDLEHSPISIESACDLIRVIDLCGAAPLVRLTSNDANQIKRIMDAGAHGIVVPMVNSAPEAARAVAATRYGPAGSRGVGLARAQGYGVTFQDYLDWQSDNPVVIVQIEHRDAIPNLEEILAVPGVDGFIVGPYDLSCSLGCPGRFDDASVIQAMESIMTVGRRAGRAVGLHLVEPDLSLLEQRIREGYTFIAYSVDFRMLDVSCRAGIARARGAEK